MKARVIVTTECNRKCVNCCNEQDICSTAIHINDIRCLLGYDQIIITGGEPMLIADDVAIFVYKLRREHQYRGKIYIYTALYNIGLRVIYRDMLDYIDGIHYTIHAEAGDQEVMELKELSDVLPKDKDWFSFRLSIDRRLYERYDFSNIDMSAWSVVRRMKWLEKCNLPEDEKLFIYELKGAE